MYYTQKDISAKTEGEKMVKGVLAIIVTYNPEKKRLEDNLNAIVPQVQNIVIVDNGSDNIYDIKSITNRYGSAGIFNQQNKGIATALNQGLEYAKQHDYEYVLTLDQDSIASEGMVSSLMKSLFGNSQISIIGPQIQDINKSEKLLLKDEVVFVNSLITSGSLCVVNKLLSVGGFEEKLFIDCVDFEMCWKLRTAGYLIARLNKVDIKHEIGKRQKKRFIYRDVYVLNHNATRAYYMARNRIYILKKYYNLEGVNVAKEVFALLRRCGGMLLYENDKLKKMTNTIKGIKDGIFLK